MAEPDGMPAGPRTRRFGVLPSLSIARSVAIVAVGIALQVGGSVALLLTPWAEGELAFLVHYVLSMGASVCAACWMRGLRLSPASFDLRPPPARSLVPLVAASLALLFGVVSPITAAIPVPAEAEEWFASLASQTGIFAFLAFVLAAPILEELLFRGVILDGLLRRYAPTSAILVSSGLFGAAHLNPWQFVTGFVIGVFAGWVYLRSRSLLACIAIHMAVNGAGFVLRLFLDLESGPDADLSLVESHGGVVPMLGWSALSAIVLLLSLRSLKRRFEAAADRHARAAG